MLIIGEQKHEEAVKALKRMCREDDDIQGCGIELSDDFLNSYIQGKNGDQKKAFKALKHYVAVRKGKYNDFFKTVLPSRCKYFQDIPKFQAFFKHKDTEGHTVGFFKLSMIDFNVVDIEDVFRGLIIAAEELLLTEALTTEGLVAIIDCRGIGLHHVKVFTPSRIQFLFNIFVGTYPIKYKGFHVMYDSFIFDPLLKLFKMFAPRKIRERIYLHGKDEASLLSSIPASILPEWLGGELSIDDCYDFEMEERAYAREEHYRKIALKW